jgi:TolA-binding protein
MSMDDLQKRIRELEEQITELKARWPAHSLQPWMLQQLEDLEAELERLKQEEQDE